MQKILVLAPHPDDDIIGCGGSIAKWAAQGKEIVIGYLTSGDAGSLEIEPEQLSRIREDEARRAGRLLGVKEFIFWRQPDGFLEDSPEIISPLVRLIRARQFTTLLLPHAQEAHHDHAAAFRIGWEACRRSRGPWYQNCGPVPWKVGLILGYEVWTPLQDVNHAEDITATIDLKMEALQQHRSQIEIIPYDEAARGLNRFRGITSGMGEYAEAFHIYEAAEFR